MDISVIVCTYNPKQEIIIKCLNSILQAMKKFPVKEVIIVDNNSTLPLNQQEFMQPFRVEPYRVVVENEQGLTPARLRGIKEATGNLLVFVDDDNFLKDDFFEKGSEIAQKYTHIGSYSGQVKLVFESTPPEWTKPYWGMLVFREFIGDLWSNLPHLSTTMPCGAGLFVRKSVADYYLDLHQQGKRKIQLDRTGKSLFSGGDNDLAACACDLGMGVGLFHELFLEHHIPAARLTKEYLAALAKGIATSSVIFKSFRNEYPFPVTRKTKIANRIRFATMEPIPRAIYKAVLDGEEEGRRMLKDNASFNP